MPTPILVLNVLKISPVIFAFGDNLLVVWELGEALWKRVPETGFMKTLTLTPEETVSAWQSLLLQVFDLPSILELLSKIPDLGPSIRRRNSQVKGENHLLERGSGEQTTGKRGTP